MGLGEEGGGDLISAYSAEDIILQKIIICSPD